MKPASRKALNEIRKLFDRYCDVCENRPVGTGKKTTEKKEKYCLPCSVYKHMETQRKKIK